MILASRHPSLLWATGCQKPVVLTSTYTCYVPGEPCPPSFLSPAPFLHVLPSSTPSCSQKMAFPSSSVQTNLGIILDISPPPSLSPSLHPSLPLSLPLFPSLFLTSPGRTFEIYPESKQFLAAPLLPLVWPPSSPSLAVAAVSSQQQPEGSCQNQGQALPLLCCTPSHGSLT